MKSIIRLAGVLAIAFVAVPSPAPAQDVYKCGARSYSQAPCSKRMVDTREHPASPATNQEWQVQQTDNKRIVATSMRRLPGESDSELALRRSRARLNASDQDECARLDTKIPFERQRMRDSVHDDEITDAQESLLLAQRRFKKLRC